MSSAATEDQRASEPHEKMSEILHRKIAMRFGAWTSIQADRKVSVVSDGKISGFGFAVSGCLLEPPNQAPEPTSMSVTICAAAQLAPATLVAHLERWATKMIPRLILVCGLLLAFAGCGRERVSEAVLISVGAPRYDALDVSMIQLISSPEAFFKKAVRVVGYLNVEFEGNALYLHEEDFSHSLSRNSLWIDAKPEVMDVLKKLSGRYVLIEGVFDATNRGHMSMSSGAISDIYRATGWPFKREKK